ncbi:tandem-95 repeat protein [Methylomicrobium sp. RS1]|nr:tandem-95 repeat protein [Methylomicrobium sp. RS1]
MADKFYIATKTDGKVGNLEFKNEDILQFDTSKNEWSVLFDGSDVGLANERINGFYVGDDYLLLSLSKAVKLNIGGEKIRVRGSDILKFNWDSDSSPGDSETKGSFELFFDGSDVGLKRNIDALTLDPDGNLVFSLNGINKLLTAPGQLFSARKQDLVRFIGNTGPDTSGYFELLFDGRKAGLDLAKEHIVGVDIYGEFLYFSTWGKFNVNDVSGRNGDILRCDLAMPILSLPVESCENPEVIFRGGNAGLTPGKLQDFQIVLSLDFALSASGVDENQPAGTLVGGLASTDPDSGDTYTYTLVAGTGDTDNGAFTIDGDQLKTAAVFDFEAKASYSLRVRSTDSGGRPFEKTLTVTVTDVNDGPAMTAGGTLNYTENDPATAIDASVTVTDQDSTNLAGATVSLGSNFQSGQDQLEFADQNGISGSYDADTGILTLSGSATLAQYQAALRSVAYRNASEAPNTTARTVTWTVDDGTANSAGATSTITIMPVNDVPADLVLSSTNIVENQPVGTAIGTFTSTDPDSGDTHTYTLVAGAGDTDNGAFTIDGDQLKTAAVFDFEAKASYSLRVRSTDSGGLGFEKVLTVTVGNAPEAPTALTLSAAEVDENQPAGTAIGTFTSIDPDSGDTHTYTLVAGAGDTDNGAFTIDGDQLKTAAVFDFEAKASYSLRVSSTDSDGLAVEKVLTVTVTDVNDRPSVTAGGTLNYSENGPATAIAPTLTVTDQDSTNLTGATVSIGSNFQSGQDVLTFVNQNGITGSYDAGTGLLTLTGTATLANYQAALRDVKYQNTSDKPNAALRTVIWMANDGLATSVSAISTINVSPVNDVPVISGQTAVSLAEDGNREIVLADLTVTDPDNTYPADFTLTVGDGTHYTHTGNTITPDANFTGTLTVPVVVNDGTDNSGSFNLTVTVTAVNDVPVISGQTAVSLAEDGNREIVLADLTVTDPDNTYPADFTLTVGDGTHYTHTGNTITPDANFTGTLTVPVVVNDGTDNSGSFNLTVTVTAVNDVPVVTPDTFSLSENSLNSSIVGTVAASDVDLPAQTLTYAITAGNTGGAFAIDPSSGQITVADGSALDFETTPSFLLTVEATDNGSPNQSGSATITVNLTNVNEQPTGVDDTATVDEGSTVTALTTPSLATRVTANDTDPDAGDLLFVTTTPVSGPTHASAFTLNADGSFSYTHDGSETTTDSFVYELCDSEPLCDTATVTITINSVNDAPVITDLASDTLAYSQNEPARVIDQGDNADASDADSADFDTGTLTLSLVDGVAGEDELGIRNQGDAAGQIGLDGANVKYGGVVIGTFSGGTGGVELVVTFDADADAAAVSALLRNITYRNSNALSPDLNNRTAHFVLTDGDGATSAAADATITVSPNTPPELTASGASPSFTEDGGAVVVDSGLTVTDTNDTDLESATVTIGNLLDSGNETLAVDTTGTSITASYSAPTLTLTGTDTVAHYQQVLRSVTYDNGSQNPDSTARTIDFKANDGSIDSNTITRTLTVTSVNDAPSLTAVNPPTVSEDAGLQTVNNWATFNAGTDESGQSVVSYTVSDVSNSALFSTPPAVAADGTLTYTPAGNASGTSTFKVVVQDNGGTANGGADTSAAQTFTITVNSVNDAPSFVKGSDQTVNEDAGLVTVNGWAASISPGPGETGQTVDFVIDSNDNPSLFSTAPAVASNGTLTFTPAADQNGVAHISLHVHDDGGTANGGDDTSDTANFTITVNAVNDPPQVEAPGPYTATGNVSVSVAAPGLLTTVSDPADGAGASPFTINSASFTSAQGGSVSVDTGTGAFTYNPPAGYEGADSFTYQVCDSGVGLPASACTSATVNFTVSGMVWFIDNTAAAGGDGRLSNPFNTLAAFQAVNDGTGNHPAAGDNIFLYESASSYTGPVTLLNNQKLLGQDATSDLATMAGITLAPNSAALPVSNSGNGTTVSITSASDAIRISQGGSNTLRGFTIGNVTAAGTGINMNTGATSFGTVTVLDAAINTNGRALNLASGTLNATFAGLTSTGGANNINLTGIAGTSNFGSGALSGASGTAFNLDGGAGSITYGGTVTNTAAARLVNIVNKSAGGVTLSGNLSGTGSSTGINVKDNTTNGTIAFSGASKTLTTGASAAVTLDNNDSATINFSGGLTVTTTSGAGFNAINGATAINVTGSGNTLASTTGIALNVSNSTIGGSGLTFQSISSNGAANGIALNNTGSNGGLTVSGTGSAGSGGTIQNGSTGISLTNTRNISLTRMQLNGFSDFAIRGSSVVDFMLDNSVINGVNGNDAAADEGSVRFTGLTGSATISNSNISGGFEDNFKVVNTSGTLDRLTFTSTTIGANSTTDGNDGIGIESQGAGTVLNVTVQNSTFTSARGDLFQLNVIGNSTADLVFTGNTLSNNHSAIATGGGGVTISGGDNTGAGANLTSNISNNTFRDALGHAILFVKSTDPGTFKATFNSNQIGVAGVANSGSLEGSGLKVQNAGLGAVTVAVTNNQIRQYNNFGIELLTGGGATALSGELNSTITGNTIANPGTNSSAAAIAKNGIHLNAGTVSGDTYEICLDAGGSGALQNSLSNSGAPNDSAAGGEDIRLRQRQDTTVLLRGYTGSANDNTAVQNYIIARNGGDGAPSAIASNQASTGSDGFFNTPGSGGACPLP